MHIFTPINEKKDQNYVRSGLVLILGQDWLALPLEAEAGVGIGVGLEVGVGVGVGVGDSVR
eukprot:1317460-Amorphochlora_amoeboformis.AAC.1